MIKWLWLKIVGQKCIWNEFGVDCEIIAIFEPDGCEYPYARVDVGYCARRNCFLQSLTPTEPASSAIAKAKKWWRLREARLTSPQREE